MMKSAPLNCRILICRHNTIEFLSPVRYEPGEIVDLSEMVGICYPFLYKVTESSFDRADAAGTVWYRVIAGLHKPDDLGPLPQCEPDPPKPEGVTTGQWNNAVHNARRVKELRQQLSGMPTEAYRAVKSGIRSRSHNPEIDDVPFLTSALGPDDPYTQRETEVTPSMLWDGKPLTPELFYNFYYNRLGWCGCGDQASAITLLRNVLEVIASPDKSPQKIRTQLGDPAEPALVLSYLYMLDAAGLTDHGCSISWAWLTDLGEAVLACLQQNDPETVLDSGGD